MISAPLFTLVWAPARTLGRMKTLPLRIVLVPLLATLSSVVWFVPPAHFASSVPAAWLASRRRSFSDSFGIEHGGTSVYSPAQMGADPNRPLWNPRPRGDTWWFTTFVQPT